MNTLLQYTCCRLGMIILLTRQEFYIVCFSYSLILCMPDFVLIIIILTLSCLPLLISGLHQGPFDFRFFPSFAAIYDSYSELVIKTVKHWMYNVDRYYRSNFRFDCYHRCLSFRTVILVRLYLSTQGPMYLSMPNLWRRIAVDLICWFLQSLIMMSILPLSNAFLY